MKQISFPTILFFISGMVFGLCFAAFGIHILKLCYAMEHPGYFLIYFFASNFIILLSLTMVAVLAFRLYSHLRPSPEKEKRTPDSSENGGEERRKP